MTGKITKERQHLIDTTITKNVLLGIVKAYGEATLAEISAKYHAVAKAEGLPIWELSDASIRGYLSYALRENIIHYKRVRIRGERYQKGMRYGTGIYVFGPQPSEDRSIRQEKRGFEDYYKSQSFTGSVADPSKAKKY